MKEIQKLSEWIIENNNSYSTIYEAGRGRPRKTDKVEAPPKEEVIKKQAPPESVKGKDAEHNGYGTFTIDEPEDNETLDLSDPTKMPRNIRELRKRFATQKDFFISGRAGWAKTALIKKMAATYKRTVLTVYIDKIRREDLGGIPIPQKDKDGFIYEVRSVPAWAAYMLKHSNKQFLLFFDEMNQADADVQNALMPIVLEHTVCGIKFKNFFVGAAGNLLEENEEGVTELSGPLKERFVPIIDWECDWDDTFNFLHKKWDPIFGKDFVNEFDKNRDLFRNPRNIERDMFKYLKSLKDNNEADWLTAEDYLIDLKGLIRFENTSDMSRTEQDNLTKLAETIYKKMTSKDQDQNQSTSGRKGRKGREMLPENLMGIIKTAMVDGYFYNQADHKKYGFSKESINNIVDIWNSSTDSETGELNEPINNEMLNRYIKVLLDKGMIFKFQKDDEWRDKEGYHDPMADD